ncbi:hypothetical protein BDN72DRAFT_903450 [Pluteus cervinus]|uniref:Uncharacterized protein n=1 Tax=Pluteus cervinus TaxID=181527 RepID=A0ACD3A907_9AGAR|nr:hypothetical protein BDN72DRAFT_903450 [Pluteus cervinus]
MSSVVTPTQLEALEKELKRLQTRFKNARSTEHAAQNNLASLKDKTSTHRSGGGADREARAERALAKARLASLELEEKLTKVVQEIHTLRSQETPPEAPSASPTIEPASDTPLIPPPSPLTTAPSTPFDDGGRTGSDTPIDGTRASTPQAPTLPTANNPQSPQIEVPRPHVDTSPISPPTNDANPAPPTTDATVSSTIAVDGIPNPVANPTPDAASSITVDGTQDQAMVIDPPHIDGMQDQAMAIEPDLEPAAMVTKKRKGASKKQAPSKRSRPDAEDDDDDSDLEPAAGTVIEWKGETQTERDAAQALYQRYLQRKNVIRSPWEKQGAHEQPEWIRVAKLAIRVWLAAVRPSDVPLPGSLRKALRTHADLIPETATISTAFTLHVLTTRTTERRSGTSSLKTKCASCWKRSTRTPEGHESQDQQKEVRKVEAGTKTRAKKEKIITGKFEQAPGILYCGCDSEMALWEYYLWKVIAAEGVNDETEGFPWLDIRTREFVCQAIQIIAGITVSDVMCGHLANGCIGEKERELQLVNAQLSKLQNVIPKLTTALEAMASKSKD